MKIKLVIKYLMSILNQMSLLQDTDWHIKENEYWFLIAALYEFL